MLAYRDLLNTAQYRVVSAPYGPMLVIAGAGTGKTRTIVYRLAWLVEHGVAPYNIVLLTFTRKAAKEMLDRATDLLGAELHGLYGGTFHAFAYRVLRQFKPAWLEERPFSVLDATDQQGIIRRCKEEANIGKGMRGFPNVQTVIGFFSKARNKEEGIGQIIARESPNVLPYADDLEKLGRAYATYKRENALLDYDDLLFELEDILRTDREALNVLRATYRHILVDEYQDTNLVQARILKLLAGSLEDERSVMAVGDEAQSIYAFRGATVRNILDFPKMFPGTSIVALEENYRSLQPILQVANRVMSYAREGYEKTLTAKREGREPVLEVECRSDIEQARCVAERIADLLETEPANEIAVLFRSGYQSYQLEANLAAKGIAYKKYGGLRYQEAAHVKDLMAYLYFIVNPMDLPGFTRIACMQPKIGIKTAEKIFHALGEKGEARYRKNYPALFAELDQLTELRAQKLDAADIVERVIDLYEPHLEEQYPADCQTRRMGLMELHTMATTTPELDLFLAEVLLDSVDREEENEDAVVLSTIHSAKGLEWKHVFVLDLVDGKLPSRFALAREEAMEEERRLMYVACTRAKDKLELYWYVRSESQASYGGDAYCTMSTFLQELDADDADEARVLPNGNLYVSSESKPRLQTRTREAESKQETQSRAEEPAAVREEGSQGDLVPAMDAMKEIRAKQITKCQHRIFGEGRIVNVLENGNLVISFPVLGTKTIMPAYVFVKK